MSVAAPTDRRFRRPKVRPTARPAFLRLSWRKAAPAALLLAAALYGGYRFIEHVLLKGAFAVSRIEVTGNNRLSTGEVLSLLDGLRGEGMVTLELEGWRQKILASPWVADVAIRRVLPGKVVVAVSERKPIAIARMGDRLYLLDSHAKVIDEFGPNYAEFDLPVIDGFSSPVVDGSAVDEARATLLWRLLTELESRQDLAKMVSQVDVSDWRDAALTLKDDPVLLRLGDDRFVGRLQSYLDIAPALRERVADIDYVDLRFDERVFVKPRVSRDRAPASRGRGQRRGGAN